MKRKLFITLSAFALLFGSTSALLLLNKQDIKQAKADGPVSGTVNTYFKTDWDSSSATPDDSYLKTMSDGQHLPLYIGGSETNLFSSTINKGGATENVKIRNYNNEGTTYYLYLKYFKVLL